MSCNGSDYKSLFLKYNSIISPWGVLQHRAHGDRSSSHDDFHFHAFHSHARAHVLAVPLQVPKRLNINSLRLHSCSDSTSLHPETLGSIHICSRKKRYEKLLDH